MRQDCNSNSSEKSSHMGLVLFARNRQKENGFVFDDLFTYF